MGSGQGEIKETGLSPRSSSGEGRQRDSLQLNGRA
jgi:hypothetical protein